MVARHDDLMGHVRGLQDRKKIEVSPGAGVGGNGAGPLLMQRKVYAAFGARGASTLDVGPGLRVSWFSRFGPLKSTLRFRIAIAVPVPCLS